MSNPIVYTDTDFTTSGGLVDPEQLREEFAAASFPSTPATFISIHTAGIGATLLVEIFFDVIPNATDESTSDALIAAHTATGPTQNIVSNPLFVGTSAEILTITSPADGLTAFNTDDKFEYQYDSSRSKWLSVDTTVFQYGSNGSVENVNIRFNQMVNSVSGPLMPRNGTVVSVTGFQDGGNATKAFEIHEDGVDIFSYALIASTLIDNNVNADFSSGTTLNVFISSAGGAVTDPTACVTVRWRL